MSAPDAPRVTLAANDDYFVSGSSLGVQVWRRLEDAQPIATMKADDVRCVACSKDGKWIAAGTFWGDIIIWDAKLPRDTHTTWRIEDVARGLDFSPDGTRLIALGDHIATIWNLTTRERVVRPLHRDHRVWAVKYSPNADRIASATGHSTRVFGTNDVNRVLHEIPVQITTCQYNTGLAWSDDHLFVFSNGKIKKINTSVGSVVEWLVPDSDKFSCIVSSKRGEFLACSAKDTVTFWDTSTHSRIGFLRHSQDIYSIALSESSSDSRVLAIGSKDEKVTIKRLSFIRGPDFGIDNTVLELWNNGRLAEAEESLTMAACVPGSSRHHALAHRALLRAHLRKSEEAINDAKESVRLQPSVIGYIAKSVALTSRGKKKKACRACDVAFQYSHPTHASFLLLIKAVVVCMTGDYVDAICRIKNLIPTLHFNIECYVVQAYMYLLHGKSRLESAHYEEAIRSFGRARTRLRYHKSHALSIISMISGWKFDDLYITIRQNYCEALYASGRVEEAGEYVYKIIRDDDYKLGSITAWASGFLQRYLSTPERSVYTVSQAYQDNASTSLEISELPFFTNLAEEWARLRLKRGSWKDALLLASEFRASKFTIYQILCTVLNSQLKILDASDCFHEMVRELGGDTEVSAEQGEWIAAFKQDLFEKMDDLGDAAMRSQRFDEAISDYSAALALCPTSRSLFMKRSRAYVAQARAVKEQVTEQTNRESTSGPIPRSYLPRLIKCLCDQALNDANKAIELDPLCPEGYESRHAALHAAERYDDAIAAFQTMLLKMSQSLDPSVRERKRNYVDQDQTKKAICRAIQDAIRDSPRVLIHTISGRLLGKSKQASMFESLPVYKELISSMTTYIDQNHIQREVARYYRYAMFSHTWEDEEPLYDKVVNMVVYDLEQSPTHEKLRRFCNLARDAGFHWAWSDTCCINKADHMVLQEALVSMFKWYEGSSVTIVFLRDALGPGDLRGCRWNTRGWTFQEYHASKVVRFYTGDWEPYLNPDVANHKNCPEIISEMNLNSIPPESLPDLRPDRYRIREKLCLASQRETTLVEDTAYSLLGIFGIALPVVYGEGDQSLGRLLAQLLTSSADTSVLAWTGKSGGYNSCLPASIRVFSQVQSPLIPPKSITGTTPNKPRASSPQVNLAIRLYDRLQELHMPSFQGQRIRLPCLTFKLGQVSLEARSTSEYIFRARADALGVVDIKATVNLSRYDSLTLVHPWIDFLLDRHPRAGVTDITSPNASNDQLSVCESQFDPLSPNQAVQRKPTTRHWLFGNPRPNSLLSPSPSSPAEKRTLALQFIHRLQQPFGALLLTPTHDNGELYRRVASQSLITVRVEELTSTVFNKLTDGVRMLDVL